MKNPLTNNPFKRRKAKLDKPHDTDILLMADGSSARIDRKIVSLVWALNSLGMKTLYSCEGEYSSRTDCHASRQAAYIMMRQDDSSMWYVLKLLSEYSNFVDMNGSFWEISFDRWEGVNRICIRFPHDQITSITDFTKYLFEDLEARVKY